MQHPTIDRLAGHLNPDQRVAVADALIALSNDPTLGGDPLALRRAAILVATAEAH